MGICFSLVAPEQQLLHEIADPSMTRDDVLLTYALAMQSGEDVDWRKINEAIMERWSMAALRYVKEGAWRKVRAGDVGEPRMAAEQRTERDEFLRDVIAELEPANVRWPGLWTRLASLMAERDALEAELVVVRERAERLQVALLKIAENADESPFSWPGNYARSVLAEQEKEQPAK